MPRTRRAARGQRECTARAEQLSLNDGDSEGSSCYGHGSSKAAQNFTIGFESQLERLVYTLRGHVMCLQHVGEAPHPFSKTALPNRDALDVLQQLLRLREMATPGWGETSGTGGTCRYAASEWQQLKSIKSKLNRNTRHALFMPCLGATGGKHSAQGLRTHGRQTFCKGCFELRSLVSTKGAAISPSVAFGRFNRCRAHAPYKRDRELGREALVDALHEAAAVQYPGMRLCLQQEEMVQVLKVACYNQQELLERTVSVRRPLDTLASCSRDSWHVRSGGRSEPHCTTFECAHNFEGHRWYEPPAGAEWSVQSGRGRTRTLRFDFRVWLAASTAEQSLSKRCKVQSGSATGGAGWQAEAAQGYARPVRVGLQLSPVHGCGEGRTADAREQDVYRGSDDGGGSCVDAEGHECSPAGVAPIVRVEVYGGGKRAEHQAHQAHLKILATLWPHQTRCMECASGCRSDETCFLAADAQAARRHTLVFVHEKDLQEPCRLRAIAESVVRCCGQQGQVRGSVSDPMEKRVVATFSADVPDACWKGFPVDEKHAVLLRAEQMSSSHEEFTSSSPMQTGSSIRDIPWCEQSPCSRLSCPAEQQGHMV